MRPLTHSFSRSLMQCIALPASVLLLAAIPALGFAADAASTSSPSSAPPKMEKLDEGPESGVTIRKPDNPRKITEKKTNGKVTEINVKNSKSEYVLKPNEPAGATIRGEVQSNKVRGAQWKVMEFDLGQKKKSKKERDAENAAAERDAATPPAASNDTANGKK